MEKLLIAPVIPFGVAAPTTSFPGTIDLGIETDDVRVAVSAHPVEDPSDRHGARRFAVIRATAATIPP